MTKLPSPPPISDNEIAVLGRVCSRALTWPQKQGDPVCGKEPFLHVVWDDDMANGFVCVEHATELDAQGWIPVDQHEVGADCGMPGALWSFKDKRCYVPEANEESELVAEAVHLLPAGFAEL